MMDGLPKIGAALAVCLAVLALAWMRREHRVTHPAFPTQTVETSSYRASYPAHWERIDTADPRLGDREVTFLNHRAQAGDFEPWDRPRMAMTVRDEGLDCGDLAGLTAKLLKDAERPGEIEAWLLANGVEARTWTEQPATTDIPSVMRWVAFRGSNGRCYSAGFQVSVDRRTSKRYEHLFRTILGSMGFK
ncbi:MAG: hypothetical protein HZB91_07590 [Elusimicrobia bacterium]|nr:hypothetical protein [Elusimicrobiota bacterium]